MEAEADVLLISRVPLGADVEPAELLGDLINRGFGGDLVPYFVVDGFKSAAVKTAVTCKNALQEWRNS